MPDATADPLGDAAPTTSARPARGWTFDAVAGWLAAQVVGGVAFAVVAALFAVPGTRLGAAVAGVLVDAEARVSDGLPLLALALWMIPAWSVQLGAVGLAVVLRGRRFVADLGLAIRPLDVPLGAVVGVGAQLAIGVVYQFVDVDVDGPARTLISKGSGTAGLVGLVLLLAICAPFVEEVLFRGLLLGGLRAWMSPLVALVTSSAIFAAVHFQTVQLPGLFLAGMVFGALALRAGRLGPAIFAHIAFNLVTVLYLGI